jgi:hypothetical protein
LTLIAEHSLVAKTAKALSLSIASRNKITIPVVLFRIFSTRKSLQQIPVKNSCQHSLQLLLTAGQSHVAKTAKVFSQFHYLQGIIAKHCLTEQNHYISDFAPPIFH